MNFHLAIFAAALVLATQVHPLGAQHRSSAFTEWERAGLSVVWQRQVEARKSQDTEPLVSFHVSTVDKTRAFEVVYADGSRLFAPQHVNELGVPLGEAEAKRLAEVEKRVLKTKGMESKILTHVTPQITVYLQSRQSVLHAINAETGEPKWSFPTGQAGFPSTAPAANDYFVAVINGSTLYVISLEDGKLVFDKRLAGAPGAGPAITTKHVFVPLMSGVVVAYPLDEKERRRSPVRFTSYGATHVRPTVSMDSVSWPSDRGFLYVADAEEGRVRFRMEARSSLVAHSVFLAPHRLLAASEDGYLFCVSEDSGRMLWQFSAGESLTKAPVAEGNQAFVVSAEDRLFAVEAERGIQTWTIDGVRQVVSVTKDHLYAVGVDGELLTIDRQTGGLLQSLPVRDAGSFLTNTVSDRLYFLTAAGRLQCLRQPDKLWPTIHVPLTMKEEEKPDEGAKKEELPPTVKPVTPAKEDEDIFNDEPPAKPMGEGNEGLLDGDNADNNDELFGGTEDDLFGDGS